MRDNPLGQGHEQTPVCVLRRLGPLPSAALRVRRPLTVRPRPLSSGSRRVAVLPCTLVL